ncbi:hypothetical protein RHMOL_Rhmol08G0174200 [Rhododendron molle]|uniref:Uncharacterized protein n=1 Tax=Rhododendron molle TaxID=49168 RepID=A0ACC0MRD8_RHOML|nr:hypothetical protein RHMOL_Rhmol08G0174200 [Rhododendron molle]
MIRTPTWSPNNSLKFPPEMQSFKPLFSCFDFDPNMERTNHFPELNPTLNSQSFMDFHIDNYFMQNPPQFSGNEFPGYLGENFPGIFHHGAKNVLPVSEPIALEGNEFHESSKRKAIYFTGSSSGNSCPPVSEDEIRRKNSLGRGKRTRENEKGEEKPKDVVHVRARRGQATDSHSLAERVSLTILTSLAWFHSFLLLFFTLKVHEI